MFALAVRRACLAAGLSVHRTATVGAGSISRRLLGHDRPGKPKGYCTAAHLLYHGDPAAAAAHLCCCGVAIILAAAAATPRGTREQDTHLAS